MSLYWIGFVFSGFSLSPARVQSRPKTVTDMKTFIISIGLLVLVESGFGQFHNNRFDQQQFRGSGGSSCPERNGRFVVNNQCDAYIECVDGVAEEKLCPDGLLFNPEARFGYPCGYPVNVNCEGRTAVQPAQSTDGCPHSYGYFRSPDVRNCGQFTNCVAGRAHVFDCPLGLAFNEATLHCDWPDQVPSCDAEAFLGFTCPAPQGSFPAANFELFRNQGDCTKYFVCVNGRPRLLACPEGTGFSEEAGDCIDAATVPGCGAAASLKQPSRNVPPRFF